MSTSVRTRDTVPLDDAGLVDLQIIAVKGPGKGAALQRMLTRCDCTHDEAGKILKRTRNTVTSWCSEHRWPTDRDLRELLVGIGLPRDILAAQWQVAYADASVVAKQLKDELEWVFDPIERFVLIADSLEEEVFIRQGFKACEDTKAAEFFTARADKYREQKRKMSVKDTRDVTPEQAQWSSGEGVYAEPVTTPEPPQIEAVDEWDAYSTGSGQTDARS